MFQKAPSHKQTKEVGVTRVYQSANAKAKTNVASVSSASSQTSNKYKSIVNKPETDYVDLKHFKDWRAVETVESDKPKYDSSPKSKVFTNKPKPLPTFNFDDDNDDEADTFPVRKPSDSKDKVDIRKFLEDLERDLQPDKSLTKSSSSLENESEKVDEGDDFFDFISNKKSSTTKAEDAVISVQSEKKTTAKPTKTLVQEFYKSRNLHKAQNYQKMQEIKSRTLKAQKDVEEKELMNKTPLKAKPRPVQTQTTISPIEQLLTVTENEKTKPQEQEQKIVKETPKIKIEVVVPDETSKPTKAENKEQSKTTTNTVASIKAKESKEIVVPKEETPSATKEEQADANVVKAPVRKVAISKVPVKKAPTKKATETVDIKTENTSEKPKSTRKPRGKSKKRFDADVITFVDWK